MKNLYLLLIAFLFSLSTYAQVGPITGTLSVCDGLSTALSDTSAGGTWSSDNVSIATVGTDGIVTGFYTGTAVISYTTGVGTSTAIVTVNPMPTPINGNLSVCAGQTTALTDASPLGTWSSSSTAVATISASGLVVGTITGASVPTTAQITYTLPTGCHTTTVVTVNPIPTAINGILTLCAGSSTTLSDFTAGGIWTSSNSSVATIGSVTAVVTGVVAGTARITYTLPTGCYTTAVATVNPVPPMTSILSSLCVGVPVSLGGIPGGTWSVSNPTVATVSPTAVVTGISPGTTTITYVLATGCYNTATLTVNPSPAPISGALALCGVSTTTLSDATTGGTWSSGNIAVATIGSLTGVVTVVSPGTATVTYSLPWGCKSTAVLSANVLSTPILGTRAACVGFTTTLSDATVGGTWSVAAAGVATVSATGVVTAISSGTTIVSYTAPSGCAATAVVTVSALPAPIAGTMTVCVGNTTLLIDAVPGGTWSSGFSGTGTVSAFSGVVSGFSAGIMFVSYTMPGDCSSVAVVTVNPLPSSITGTAVTCVGATLALTDATVGGTWSSSFPAIGSVSGTGLATGIAAGTTIITYTLPTGCFATRVLTVNPAPLPIAGTYSVCFGGIAHFSDAIGGGTWSSTNPLVASVTSGGYVTGNLPGTATISYTVPGGCYATATISVNITVPSITGTLTACTSGGTTTLSDAVTGGMWVSSNYAVATVGTGSGIVTGNSAGTAAITYLIPATGCINTTTVTVAICSCSGPPDTGIATATTTSACYGRSVTFSLSGVALTLGTTYQWQTSPDGAAWGDMAGATTSSYSYVPGTSQYYRCEQTCTTSGLSAFSLPVHVSELTAIGTHSVVPGSDTVCTDAHFYLSTCGISSDDTVVTYFGDGTSASVSLTTTTVSNAHVYHSYTSSGMYTVKQVLYNGGVAADSVTFPYTYSYCHTLPVKLFYDTNGDCVLNTGETFNSLPTSVEIDSNGVPVDTVSATSGLYYRALGPAGTIYAFTLLTAPGGLVVACPVSGVIYDTISSASAYSVKYFALNCSTSASYDLSITATQTNGRHMQQTTMVVYNSLCTPVMPVVTMTSSPKYTNIISGDTYPAPASVSGNIITWNLPSLAAGASTTVHIHMERPSPWLTAGDTIMSYFKVTPMDADSANNMVVRCNTVNASYDPNNIAVVPSGYVLPCTKLQYQVMFENTGNDTAHNIHVIDTLSDNLDAGSLTINSSSAVMNTTQYNGGGHNIVIFDFPNINLLDTSHHVADGMVVFSINAKSELADGVAITNKAGIYFDDNEVVMTNIVQNTIGIATITGQGSFCLGTPDTLMNASAGGAWSASNTDATVMDGVLAGVMPGLDTISYTVSNICASRTTVAVITINTIPALSEIGGTRTVCVDATTALSDTALGGTWSSDAIGVATVADGIVTGVSAGTAVVSYMASNTCGSSSVMSVVTVNPLPDAGVISGIDSLCTGISTTFSTTASAGVWSSSNASATVADGLVEGVAPGVDTISYMIANSCGSQTAVKVIAINAIPVLSEITGTRLVCVDASTSLSDTATGGAWSSGATGIATVSGGVVVGVSAGTTAISYVASNSCGTSGVASVVTVNPLPDAGTVSGPDAICVGASTILASTAAGGSWSTSATGVATVGSAGEVNGLSAGTALISYMVSNSCGTDTSVYMETINPNVLPALSIAAFDIDTICEGSYTTFTVVESNGGSAPVYQWQVNSVNASTASIYTYMPVNGDVVSAVMISNAACASPDTAAASVLIYTEAAIIPVVSMTASNGFTIAAGETDTLTATVTGGGSSPSYQWLVNGTTVPGATNSVYYSTFNDHDSVTCQVTSSGLCAGYTSYNSVYINVAGTGVTSISSDVQLILYPNPATNELNLAWKNYTIGNADVVITDVAGREVYTRAINITAGSGHARLDLPSLPEGIYLVTIKSNGGMVHAKVEIRK